MKVLLIIIALLSSFEAFSYSNGRNKWRLRFLPAVELQRASLKSRGEFIEKRSLMGLGLDLKAGLNKGPYIFGMSYSYSRLIQSTDPDRVSDTNVSGAFTNYGVFGGVGFGRLGLFVKYIPYGKYSLSQKTHEGRNSEYSDVSGSYALTLTLRSKTGSSFWGLNYQRVTFSKARFNSSEVSLGVINENIDLNQLSLSYGFLF